jgi:hypothetical protein
MEKNKQVFMSEFALPQPFPPEFMSKIQKQRQFINGKMLEGTIKSYAVSADLSKLWMVTVAEDEWVVLALIAEMPLAEWLHPNISALMFYNTAEILTPFSLN